MNNNLSIKEINSSDRPRERLFSFGPRSLSNAELLAIIISCGTKKESAYVLAERVLNLEKGNLAALYNYEPTEFTQIAGIGNATACKIAASIEFGRRVCSSNSSNISLSNPASVADYCSDLKFLNKEIFRIILFNSKLNVIKNKDVSVGNINSANASPREVFSEALRNGAYGIILVHNHPSGDSSPSKADISSTKQLIDAGKLLGISVLDHIIIGKNNYFSMKEKNILYFL